MEKNSKEAADEFWWALYLLSFHVEVLMRSSNISFPLPQPVLFLQLCHVHFLPAFLLLLLN